MLIAIEILMLTAYQERYMSEPEKYRQFLKIVQAYQIEDRPLKEVYTSVASLFSSAPELVEDFKLFLPAGSSPS